ncbi:MAG: hypothetical protein MUC83_15530 [Pirellula sp.]|nr:hypothetical protein [Pirellula sp.]
MSEFQVVEFRAVDRPLTNEQMEFMDRQSSRAEFSKWDYSVEYHYSSFRGDINGMLRNGYDIFVMDTNFGQRELRLRFPTGMPFSRKRRARRLSLVLGFFRARIFKRG